MRQRAAVAQKSSNASAVPSDSALVAASLAGDREAFGMLVGRYKGMVMGRIYAIVGDRHEAEDLAQESFVRAYRALSQLEQPSEFASWLGSIARNAAVTARARRRPAPAGSLSGGDATAPAPAGRPAAGDPAEAAARHELYEMALREIESLPEEYRSTVYLRYLRNRSCREIAEIEGVAVGVVTSRLSRAAAALRGKLGPVAGERAN